MATDLDDVTVENLESLAATLRLLAGDPKTLEAVTREAFHGKVTVHFTAATRKSILNLAGACERAAER
jgi:hypothetical protein